MLTDQEPKSRQKSAFREILETIVFTLLIYFLIRTFLFENYRVVGKSMVPALQDDEYLVVNKLVYRLHEPQRGDIIVLRERGSGERKLIKRVIGLPGETLAIESGQVTINGQLLDEPYIQNPDRSSRSPAPIPEGHYFVMGDNRSNSSDSRNWGPLPGENVVGKALITYWPVDLWGIVPHVTYENVP
jgi:signal peptidase I